MKKPFILLILALLLTTCVYSFGQDSPKIVDNTEELNEIDNNLFNTLKESGQSEAEICQWLGVLHINKENWERASTYFKKAVSLNPRLYLSWYNLGLLYIDTEEGNSYFKKAIDAEPDFPASYYWLAFVYCRNRQNKEAIRTFKKYIELAESIPSEATRYKKARQVLAELLTGRESKELWKIRKQEW